MRVTEEEAKTKRCQESFGDNNVSPAGHAIGMPVSGAYHHGATLAVQTSPSHCIGSACMAWRWAEVYEGANIRGYCGKAGPA